VRDQRTRVEDVRGTEGMQPEKLEMWRRDGPPRRVRQVRRVHPELAGSVVADEADPLQPRTLGDRGAKEDRLHTPRICGDPLQACQLSGRLHGDRADPGRDRGGELVVALARAGHHDAIRGDPGAAGGLELTTRRDIGAEAEATEVVHHGECRVRLDRVCQVDPWRQDRPESRHLALDDIEVVDVERRPEPFGKIAGGEAAEPSATHDLIAGRRTPAAGTGVQLGAHRRASSSATRADVPASRSLTISATDADRPCCDANGP
jgi:hypothetical protein